MIYQIPDNNGSQDEALSRASSVTFQDLSFRGLGFSTVPFLGSDIAPISGTLGASITAGYYIHDRELLLFDGGSVSFSANSSGFDRFDIIELDADGTLSVIEGTAASTAYEPARSLSSDGLRPTNLKVAAALIKDGDTELTSSQILQRMSEATGARHGVHYVNGYPGPTVGRTKDLAINVNTQELFYKTGTGWSALGWHYSSQCITRDVIWGQTAPLTLGSKTTTAVLRRIY